MAKTLRSDIIIGGKADSSFYKLGNELETLGNQVNRISEKLIDFGKESVKAYASYEDYILDAEVALRAQYESTGELSRVMAQLDKAAMKWASDSRFTTEDVAGAISNAAHAGWDLEKMLEGVPAAMKISLAGGMELSEGLEYLVDISNAAGIQFDQLGMLVDDWAYAANRSSTTIPEMGQAMQKMGATMQFVKGDMAGLTTMLGVLANNGAKGTEAGTLLRNSFIRMIAPTKKAAEAMDDLVLSGEDLDDIYSNANGLEEANAMLEEAGFAAYDSEGKLKSFLQIWQELDRATSGMSEQDRNSILSAIFPTRTITGALALLDAASNDWDGLYSSIQNNGAGYADYAAQKMESGLGGTLRHLESVYNTLQTRTGKELAEPVGAAADAIASMIDSVNNMDDAAFGALVSGLEVVAAAGPTLLVAGGALKIIGAIASTGLPGALILASIGIGAVAAGLHTLSEEDYADNFGRLAADTGKIGDHLARLGDHFAETRKEITKYNDALETAVSDYEEASTKLKEDLLTSMLAGATLTQTDMKNLYALGDQMRAALLTGIDGSYSSAEETVALFANEDAVRLAQDENSLWAGVMDTLNYGYEQAIMRAEELGAELRRAMTSAFADGALTSEEIENIQNVINQQNELIAIQAEAKNAMEREKMLRQAQTMGLDQLGEISGLVEAQRAAELGTLEENYWQAYYQTQLGGVMKIRNGVRKADGSLYTQADLDRELEALYSGDANDPTDGYLGKKLAAESTFDRMLLDLYNTTASGSTFGEAWGGLGKLADSYMSTGAVTQSALREYDAYSLNDRNDITRYINEMVDSLGGLEDMQARADYYAGIGDLSSANMLSRFMAMYTLSSPVTSGLSLRDEVTRYSNGYDVIKAREQNAALEAQDEMTTLAWEYMRDAMQSGVATYFQDIMINWTDTGYQSGINDIVEQLRGAYDLASVPVAKGLESIHDYAAAYKLMFDDTINAEEYKISVKVDGDTTALGEAIEQFQGAIVNVNVNPPGGHKKYATGGRATEASIFGEAGPEWAIPEEYSQRTAELLDAARAASGFTWPDLIGRNGGLNSGKTGNWTLVYSPVINAANAEGVEQKLREDKQRLEKWMRDRQLHDETEVYA